MSDTPNYTPAPDGHEKPAPDDKFREAAVPKSETGLSETRTGEHGTTEPFDSNEKTEFVTRKKDDAPTAIDRVKSLLADAVLHGFLATCAAYIFFNFTLPVAKSSNLESFLTEYAGVLPLILGLGAVLGIGLNALNLSWVSNVFGYAPKIPIARVIFVIAGWVLLGAAIVGAFGWQIGAWLTDESAFHTGIKLDAGAVMIGTIVGGILGLLGGLAFSFPVSQILKRPELPPGTPASLAGERPISSLLRGRFIDGFFAILLTLWAGWFVTGINISRLMEPGGREHMYGVVGRFLNVFGVEELKSFDVPPDAIVPISAIAPISPSWTATSVPANAGEFMREVQFFNARRPGKFVIAPADAANTASASGAVTVQVTKGVELALDAAGRLQPIAAVDGVIEVPPQTDVPLPVMGLSGGKWTAIEKPAGAANPLGTHLCFVPNAAGDYVFDQGEINAMYTADMKLPGQRAVIHVREDAALSPDPTSFAVKFVDSDPSWGFVEQAPRAWSRFAGAIPTMIETVFLALMATVLAVPLAFVLSFFAAQNLMCTTRTGTLIYYVVRTFLNIIRSIEPLCWAIVFSVWVSVGTFPGVLALMVHTVASLAKLYSEQIEGIESGPMEAILATGASPLQVVRHAIVPQIVPPFISFTMYRWDINVRMAPILGFVGGGGIGMILSEHFSRTDWEEVGVIILLITIVVAAMDFTSAKIRAKLV